jgi:hypothetical protein
MGIIKIFKKGTRELTTGVDTWVVEWTSRHGPYSSDTRKRFQAFTDHDEAEAFAEEIRRAHSLIGNTCYSETQVYVRKQESGL